MDEHFEAVIRRRNSFWTDNSISKSKRTNGQL